MRHHHFGGGLLPALAFLASSAAAQTAAPPEKSVSPFILCDGHTGHVGLAASLGRLVLLTATAGLSETATATDDEMRRLKGAAAADACDTALTQEHDNLRRAQLATAKAIHLMEAGRIDDSLVAVHAVPAAAGPLAQEWGYKHTFAPRLLLLEAAIQARRKDAEAAQAAAVRAVTLSPYDLALAHRALRYMVLTSRLDPDRDRALIQLGKVMSEHIPARAGALTMTGRFAEAYDTLTAAEEIYIPFYDDFHPQEFRAHRALLLALAGRDVESDALAKKVQDDISSLTGTGFMVQQAAIVASASEYLGLRGVLRDLANGRGKEARATFRAHGPWLLASAEVVPAVVDRLRTGAPAEELTGTLAEPGEVLRARHQAEQLAALADPKLVPSEYQQPFLYASTSDFARIAGATWKVGDKPRFLLKHEKEQLPSTDVLDGEAYATGLAAGEAILLQAALIAKKRGLNGFVLKPVRRYAYLTGLRFGNIGDPGIPSLFAYDANAVIADIAPHIPEPAPIR